MIIKMLQYTVQEENTETAVMAITELLDAIRRFESEIKYDVFRFRGTQSFIHIIEFPNLKAEHTHQNASHTKQFLDIIKPYCIEPPDYIELETVEGKLGGEYE